jgi:hypothetical protein
MVSFKGADKDAKGEYFVTDSFSLDSAVLTIKQDCINRTFRIDCVESIYIF